MDIARGRLVQERWFSLIRWLLALGFFLQIRPETELPRFVEANAGVLLVAFVVYTLIVTIAAATRTAWTPGLAYTTAALDALFAAAVAAQWSELVLNPGLVGVGAAAVGIGARRFPIYDTFGYALLIELAMLAAHFAIYHHVAMGQFDMLVVTSFAMLPVLARAVTLSPNPDEEGAQVRELAGKASNALLALPSENQSTADELFPPAASALATYSDSQLAGVVIQTSEDQVDLYTVSDGQDTKERLAVPAPDQLAARLLAISQPTVLTRRDDLTTRGLPDQYPTRLDSLVATPLRSLSNRGATLFAANKKGGVYLPEDQILAAILGSEVSRLKLAHDFAVDTSQALLAAADALLAAADAKRPGSKAQAEESARFAIAIARELGWSDKALEELGLAALLHDVGEIAVPDALLDKADQLTPEEFEIVKQHPRIAARIIDPLNRSKVVLDAIYAHHERWDGRGYPSGLTAEEIPEGARILSLAHAMDAMLSPRPYRPPIAPADALQELILGSGTQFDPSAVQAFLAVLKREGEAFLQRRETSGAIS